MTKCERFLSILNLVAPAVLMALPATAPIAGILVHAMTAAEHAGGTGTEKLNTALVITNDAIAATNTKAGRQVLDPTLVNAAVADGISAAIKATKIVRDVHPDAVTAAA